MSNTSSETTLLPPNHHAHFRGLSGFKGWIAARTMSTDRTDAANLAIELSNLEPGDRVVHTGAGPGAPPRRSAERGAIPTGIEPAGVMLRAARKADRRK